MPQSPSAPPARPRAATSAGRQVRTAPGRKPTPKSPALRRPAPQRTASNGPPPKEPAQKKPLWVRWVALVLFVAVLGTVFVNMGDWQLRRLAERKASNHRVVTNEAEPVADFGSIFTAPIGKALEWRRVTVSGIFDPTHQYVVRYRDNGGAQGYEVVTPLHTGSGKTVLIDRGFISVQSSSSIPAVGPPPPTGEVSITGRVRRSEAGRRNAITPVDGQMRLINAYAVATTLPYPVVDGYIDQLQITPAQTGAFQPVLLPELSDGPHFWYAVQWFMFTGIGIAGIFVFIRGDLRERKAARADAAAAPPESGPAPAGPPESSAAERRSADAPLS